MGLKGDGETNIMLELGMASRHKRSKSFPGKKTNGEGCVEAPPDSSQYMKQESDLTRGGIKSKKKPSQSTEVHNSLKQEILQLEKRLQDQFEVRRALEKALGYRTSSTNDTTDVSMPKPATSLIKEIAALELEVVYLEQYLLSLYRKAFDQQVSAVSPSAKDEKLKSPVETPRARVAEVQRTLHFPSKEEDVAVQSGCRLIGISQKDLNGYCNDGEGNLLDSGVQRCHSSLSQYSALISHTSPEESLGKAVRACHSQPSSMMEYARNATTSVISLAEYLGTSISDHIPESPNQLSEAMIKCMSIIYCKLSDPPVAHHGLSSPNSSFSSASAFSPRHQSDMWSPGFRNNSSFDVRLDNPFHVEGLKEFSGPYSTMVEVPCLHRDSQKLGDIEHLLQDYRSFICRLEEVDLRKLKHEEKVAFWINIHNALVMHAYLAYGIPQNNVKRVFLLLKAAYNIGGHTINADTIQSTILGCRLSRPGQWIRAFLSPKKKFKTGDKRQTYGIDHPEPLLYFALCFGSHSDPAVRVYTPKTLYQELEAAKDEYIRANFGIRKDKKILLPKILELFAKDSGMSTASLIEMIQQTLPESVKKSLRRYHVGKSQKNIQWVPHNFRFRYIISKELAR